MLITNNPDKVYFGPLVSYKGDLRPSLFQLGLIGSWRRKNSFSLYGSSMASIQGVYNYTFWSLFKQLKFSHNRFIFVLKWSNYLEHLCVMLRQKDLPMNDSIFLLHFYPALTATNVRFFKSCNHFSEALSGFLKIAF